LDVFRRGIDDLYIDNSSITVWTQLSIAGGPPPGRDGANGVYDRINRLIVFAG
jgi:hypothetical protein